jgi:hypothetical protein
MKILITDVQKEKLFSLIESDRIISPEVKEMYKNVFGDNPDFKKGYEKGYIDGWVDAKGNQPYNEKYSWSKYSGNK